jgi:3-dehydroquinate synthase
MPSRRPLVYDFRAIPSDAPTESAAIKAPVYKPAEKKKSKKEILAFEGIAGRKDFYIGFMESINALADQMESLSESKKTLIIIDDHLLAPKGNAGLDDLSTSLTEFFDAFSETECEIYSVQAGEDLKTKSKMDALLELTKHDPPDQVVIVGGGTVINFGYYFCAETTMRRQCRAIVFPTNSMALCDVALGSTGYLNDGARKNILKHIFDPDFITLVPDFFQHVPVAILKEGLAEAVKHGLLQSRFLLQESLNLIADPNPDPADVIALSVKTMKLKGLIMAQDPPPKRGWIYDLLAYGHLHAHALEAATDFQLSHGQAVLLGLAMDQCLERNYTLARQILRSLVLSDETDRVADLLQNLDVDKLVESYRSDTRHKAKGMKGTDVTDVFIIPRVEYSGQYASMDLKNTYSYQPYFINLDECLTALGSVRNLYQQFYRPVPANDPIREPKSYG